MQIQRHRPAERPLHCEADSPCAGEGVTLSGEVDDLFGEVDDRKLLTALIDQIPDFIFVKDVEGRFLIANQAIARAYGMRPEQLVGKTDHDLHPRDRADQFFALEQLIVSSGRPNFNMEESFPDQDGAAKVYSTTKVPLRDGEGRTIGLIGIARDITERKQTESLEFQQSLILEMIAKNHALPQVLEKLTLLIESQLDHIRSSILIYDATSNRLRIGARPSLPEAFSQAIDGLEVGPSAGSCGTAAYRREPVITTDIGTDPLWDDYRHLALPFGLRSCWSTPILSHDGSVLGTFAMYSADVRAPTAGESRMIELATRIAGIAIERHLAEDRIRFMAHHDPLTGLVNRTLLNDRLARALINADRERGSVSVAFVDLDNFKTVNDGLGHGCGDKLLKTVAARMAGCVRACDSLIRLGGDEFVFILPQTGTDADAVAAVLQRIRGAVSDPIEIEGHHFQVTCSLGISTYPRDGADPETLLRNADAAMYSAKGSGRDRIQFYTTEMNAKVLETLHIEEQLRSAIARSELHVVYQPQVDLRSGRIFAAEALVRWDHPRLGAVSPARFIPIAERTGLIVAIGDWVLRQACRQNQAWQDNGLDPIGISVNVSARQFREKDWIARVQECLTESGMRADCLELEITESMLMHELPKAIGTMQELTELGIHLAIDDFGTGYSSLNALKSFPVSRLKIDQSFVQDLAEDESDRAIAAAVISLGHELGLRVIAEGVETRQQLDFLIENRCDEVQGFLCSRPLPAAEFEAMLRQQIRPLLPVDGTRLLSA